MLGKPREVITLESKIEDLTNDSIQLFELILAFEREFKAEADYTDLMSIETVADVVAYLEKRYPPETMPSGQPTVSSQ